MSNTPSCSPRAQGGSMIVGDGQLH
jgi:hypothetical protein